MTLTSEDLQGIEKLVRRVVNQELDEKFKTFRQELYHDFAHFIETAITPQLDNHYQRLASLEKIHPLGTHS